MNSLFQSVASLTSKRHILIREALQTQLKNTVIEVQGAPGVLERNPVEVCDESLALCASLEAIFLHGLRDSLFNRVTEVFSGPDYETMPQPSFWGPLMIYSHKDIINQITSSSQITTEVGYCRVWIRIALNEGVLGNYLETIRRDNSSLSLYYNRSAFIRDLDLVEVAQRLLESIEHIQFRLDYNTTLLNYWSSMPLMLAGMWTPPMKTSNQVSYALDVAKTISADIPIEDNSEDIDIASSIGSMSSFASLQNNFNGLSEDEAFKLVLEKKCARPSNLRLEGYLSNSKVLHSKDEIVQTDPAEEAAKEDHIFAGHSTENFVTDADPSNKCNALFSKFGFEETNQEDTVFPIIEPIKPRTSVGNALLAPSDHAPFDALINSYRNVSNFQPPKLEDTPASETSSVVKVSEAPLSTETSETSQMDEEVVEETELATFEEQLVRLTNELGLDQQNYTCYECNCLIGLHFHKAYICGFTSKYFCSKCIAKEEYLIPAKVIHNWDLKRYPVSTRAADYLSVCPTLIDLKRINSKIYGAVQDMAQLQSLRVQLNLLRAYLNTCREPIHMNEFHKKLAPREYLYEHVHQYSVTDFSEILSGTLARHLRKVVEFASKHVKKCWLCTQKGFICEICNDPDIIFPFDLESTYRCASCCSVFHSKCLKAKNPCPKCERKQKRKKLASITSQTPQSPQVSAM